MHFASEDLLRELSGKFIETACFHVYVSDKFYILQ